MTDRKSWNSTLRPVAKRKIGQAKKLDQIAAGNLKLVRKALSPSKNTKSLAKGRAWDWFSKFIRLRDADEHGYIKCITCGTRRHWRDRVDAGHFVTRAKESTLFDEKNVHAQCKGCNRFQGGKFLEHGVAINRKYGPGTKERLEIKALQHCKRTLTDYLFIEQTYKLRVKTILEKQPGKA
jgi:hypothetical protein